MKYIKLFENFNEKDIISNLKDYDIENYTINIDGTIDVDGDVQLNDYGFDLLPFKFGRVTGKFDCSYNKLNSLEGCPYYVGGDFTINSNQKLKNLIGSPVEVGGDFECFNCNKLESLEGMPLEIGGYFNCRYTSIEDLDSVSNIEGEIFCDDDVDISKFRGYCTKISRVRMDRKFIIEENTRNIKESLENFEDVISYAKMRSELVKKLNKYGIKNYTINRDGTIDVKGGVDLHSRKLTEIPFNFGEVSGDFNVNTNELTSLNGSPYYVGGSLFCSKNLLKDLKGSPIEVGEMFVAIDNRLESLEGMTTEIGGSALFQNNVNLKEFDCVSNIGGTVFVDKRVDVSMFSGECGGLILVD